MATDPKETVAGLIDYSVPAPPRKRDLVDYSAETLTVPDPEDLLPTPAPPIELPPLEIDLRSDEQIDLEVREMWKQGNLIGDDANRYAGLRYLSQKTGLEKEVVESKHREIRAAVREAEFNPRRWRHENPGQYAWIKEDHRRAALMPALEEEHVSSAVLNIRAALSHMRMLGPGSRALMIPDSAIGIAEIGGSIPGLGEQIREVVRTDTAQIYEEEKDTLARKKRLVPTVELGTVDPSKAEEFSRRPEGAIETISRGLSISKHHFSHERQGLNAAHLGFAQIFMEGRLRHSEWDNPTDKMVAEEMAWNNQSSINGLLGESAYSINYGEEFTEAEQLGMDIVKGTASQVEQLGAMGAGAVLGGGGGFLVAGPPGAVAAGYATVKSLAFMTTMSMEAGGAYNDFIATRDNKGKLMDPDIAAGAAVLYGIAAAGIELVALGPQLKAFGPLKGAIVAGEARRWMKRAMARKGTRQIFKNMFKGLATSMGAEAGEEWAQETLQYVTRWAASSTSAGEIQELDAKDMLETGLTSAYYGAVGSLGMGGAQASTHLVSASVAHRRAVKEGKLIEAIAGLAESDNARQASRDFSSLVDHELAQSGEKVTHAYIDPQAFIEKVEEQGADPKQIAEQIFGPEGPDRMRQALAKRDDSAGNRATFEMTLEEYLEKFGATELSGILTQNTSVRDGGLTLGEQANQEQEIRDLAKRLEQEGIEDEDDIEVGPHELEFVKVLQDQAVKSGRVTVDQARKTMAPFRAFIKTQLKRSPVAADAVFRDMVASVKRAEQWSPHQSILGKLHGQLGKSGQIVARYIDRNTGILNADALEIIERDPSKPMTARFSLEGKKALNDEHSHLVVDGALRVMARVAGSHNVHAVKRGGGIEIDVVDQAEADLLASGMELALDPERRIRVTAPAVMRAGDTDAMGAELGKATDALEKVEMDEGRLAKRGKRPVGLTDTKTFNELAQNWRESSFGDAEVLGGLGTSHEANLANLSVGDAFHETYVTDAGLWNELGFTRLVEIIKPSFVSALDVRGLGNMNDTIGRDNANVVLALVAEGLAEAGSEFGQAHLHGDEFATFSDDKQAMVDYLDAVKEEHENILLYGQHTESGGWFLLNGIQWEHGTKESYENADKELRKRKETQDVRAVETFGSRQDVLRRIGELRLEGKNRRPVDIRPLAERFNQRKLLSATKRATIRLLQEADNRVLADPAAREAGAAARITAAALVNPNSAFRSNDAAWSGVIDATFPNGASPTEQADSTYTAWRQGRGSKPKPYADTSYFDDLEQALGAKARRTITSGRHAFDLLVRVAEGDRIEKVQHAVSELKQVEGFGDLRLPDDMETVAAERQMAKEAAEQAFEYFEAVEQGFITEDDADTREVDTFYQPAWHGTPHRGIERSRQLESESFKRWFGNSAVVDETGAPQRVYHGTARPDRVGDRFRKSRATSGPSAFFTDDPAIASNYATGKQDTSLVDAGYERGYGTWYKLKVGRSTYDIDRAWYALDLEQREELSDKLPRVVRDKDGEADTFSLSDDDTGLAGRSHWDWTIRKKRGNTLAAAADIWLESGGLFDEEELFGKILREAGLEGVKFDPPNLSEPAVVPVYLSLQNPFDTSGISDEMFDAIEKRSRRQQSGEKRGADNWDKQDTPAHEWVDQLRRDREKNTTLAWTRVPDWVTRLLKQQGYDGIKDTGGKHTGVGHTVWIPFEPAQIKSAIGNMGTFDPSHPSILRQDDEASTPNGFIDILKQGAKRAYQIFLTPKSDLSTMLHEQSHLYLEVLGDISEHAEADQRVKDDFKTILRELGATSREELTVEQKEKFARSFESYFMEGKAPSAKLVEAFTAFGLWLKKIYQTLRSIPGSELNADLRQVFDRMLATDDQIKRMRQAAGIDVPTFRTFEAFGGTADEYRAYLNREQKNTTLSAARAATAIAKDRGKALKKFKSEETISLRKDAEKEWAERPDVLAYRRVRFGEVVTEDGRILKPKKGDHYGKLHEGKVKDTLGAGSALFKRLKKAGRLRKDGMHPAELAMELGYTGPTKGADMLAEIAGLPDKKEWVKKRAEEMVVERHPELEPDINATEEKIQRSLHDDKRTKQHLADLRSLRKRRRAGELFAAGDIMADEGSRIAARNIVNAREVGRLSTKQTLNRERAAAEKVAEETAKHNYDGAVVAKLRQMLEHYTWRELDKAIEDRKRFEKLAKRMAQRSRRELIAQADTKQGRPPDMLDAVDQILEALGVMEPQDLGGRVRKTAGEVFRAMDATGDGAAVDVEALDRLMADPPEGGWRKMTVENMRLAHRALAQLYTISRDGHSIVVEGERRSIDLLALEIDKEASETLPDLGPPGDPKYLKRKFASMLNPQETIRRLGPTAYKALWADGYMRSKYNEDALLESIGDFFTEAWENLPKYMQNRRYDVMEDLEGVELPADLDVAMAQDHQWMWMVALNMGNRSNRDRLLGGYEWSEQEVTDWLNRNMTDEEWNFVQSVWDLLDKELYPQVAKTHEEATGLPPDKIEPLEIVTESGKRLTGGYIPARYHPVASRRGAAQAKTAAEGNYARSAASISVSKTFTKQRSEKYSDVVLLDWGVVPGHILQVARYVSFDRFVRQAKSLMLDDQFKETAHHRIGIEYYENLINDRGGSWLGDVAGAYGNAVPPIMHAWKTDLDLGRRALNAASIAWSLPIALADMVGPFESAMMTTGAPIAKTATSYAKAIPQLPWWAARAFSDAYNPEQWQTMRDRALTLGKEPKRRSRNIQMQVRGYLDNVGKRQGKHFRRTKKLLRQAEESGYFFLDMFDRLTTTIIWDAAFRDAVAKGHTDKESAALADDTVVSTMPTQVIEEMPAVLRDRALLRSLLIFFTYFSRRYQQSAATMGPALAKWGMADGFGEKMKAAGNVAAASGRTYAMMVTSMLFGGMIAGHGPEPDEEKSEWVARMMLAAPFQFLPFAGGPAQKVSDAAVSKAFTGEAKYRRSFTRTAPLMSVVEKLERASRGVLDDERDGDQRFWDAMTLVGLLTITPLASPQFIRSGRYLTDLATGQAADASPSGVVSGTIYGEREDQRLNPLTIVD